MTNAKTTLFEGKLSGSDGHVDVLNAGRMNPSAREFDELDGGAFKKEAVRSTQAISCACCTGSNTTCFGASHEGKRPRENDEEPRQDSDAEEDYKTSSTRSGMERSDEKAKVPKDVSDCDEDCEQDSMQDPEQVA